ncbi:MAG TPA: LuxR C-terminal-related transcriptional regulator [Lacipirellulaceae bacterium]|nr:LuxR C-terminal-related transcriptional regulator [Lacipirellulaceae bacterium]
MSLPQEDISSVIRLVREVCDRWDDPHAWRAHLLSGMCQLIQANTGSAFDSELPGEGRFGKIRTLAVTGPPDVMSNALIERGAAEVAERPWQEVSDQSLPGIASLFAEFASQGWVTTMRRELVDDASHYASAHYRDLLRPADADDYIWSIRWVDAPQRVESLIATRPHGATGFGPREILLMKLLHDEIAPLVGVRLATEEHLCRDGLSKRLRETLSLLLEGLSEKEVAQTLGLSASTVHEYVVMLYKHFRVSSRAQLLAYFIRRTPAPRTEECG